MFRTSFAAAALLAAIPAFAQDAPPAGSPATIQQAAAAFGECVGAGIRNVDASLAPEAGAASVLGGCASQRAQLEQAVEAVLAAAPEEHKAAGREQFRTQMAQAEGRIADAIRQMRAAMAAAPASTE